MYVCRAVAVMTDFLVYYFSNVFSYLFCVHIILVFFSNVNDLFLLKDVDILFQFLLLQAAIILVCLTILLVFSCFLILLFYIVSINFF